MKVKVLTHNIMFDYKKLVPGDEIELPENIAHRLIKAGLVEKYQGESPFVEPLIVNIDGLDVDLGKLSVKELAELSSKYNLGISQESKEKKDAFAKRIFDTIKKDREE